MVQRLCIIEDCFEPKAKWGMCPEHSELWKKLVRNERQTKLFGWSDRDRFNYYLIKVPSEEIQQIFGAKPDCWVWKGALNENGYGIFKSSSRSQHTHLFALSALAGVTLFPEEETDHRCRFRPCTNPEHLERVTHQTNTLRGIGPSAVNARKQHCINGHEFTRENTRFDSNGRRSCIKCEKAYTSSEEYKAARREAYEPVTGIRGKGQYQAERDTCTEGHPIEGDNLFLEKRTRNGVVSQVRRCKTCRLKKQRDNYARKNSGEVAPGIPREDCCTSDEIAEILGVTRSYLPTFMKRQANFPSPVKKGKPNLYLRAGIVSWRNEHMTTES